MIRRPCILTIAALLLSGGAIAALPPTVELTINGERGTYRLQPATVPVVDTGVQPAPLPATLPAPKPPAPGYVAVAAAAKEGVRRGNGPEYKTPGKYANILIDGYEQNAFVDDGRVGTFTFENFRSIGAWRGLPTLANIGQGFYGGKGPNTIVHRGVYMGFNGWQKDKQSAEKTDRRHGVYINEGDLYDAEDFIWDQNSSQGGKLMRNSRLKNGFIHANAIGISQIYGDDSEWEDVVMYGGSYYVDGSGHPTANIGVVAYCPVKATRVAIVGKPLSKTFNPKPGAKVANMGAVKLEKEHGQYKNLTGGKIDATDCLIAGWAGPAFSGGVLGKQTLDTMPGWTIYPDPVDVDVEPILAAVRSGIMSPAEGVKLAQKLVLDEVKKQIGK